MNPRCVLTGHFLPPTGFDPWLGLRHDYSPQEDFQQQWVRRNRACYGANSASRILTSDGRIRDIVNNYCRMNFSVSPLLLDELRRSSPNVYRRMIEGDEAARVRTGHGSALARPWSETILPLLSPDGAAWQIDLGLRAFRHHFGRDAEGFCLPFDAVNGEVLDLLVDRGLRFVLLSGTQAEGIMAEGTGSWQSLNGAPAPGDRPFRIDRPRGSLAAFFPDERLSRGLIQDHLLRDAARLEAALRQAVQTTGFVHLASAAEAFGWDEPFSDMCLAVLWERLGGSSPLEVTTYGAVLEGRPPRELVKLRRGDDDRGSSSACPHGVGRWHRDCGCRDSASHQGWKQPLFELYQRLDDEITQEVDLRARAVGTTAEALRAALPDLLLGIAAPRPWARAFGPTDPASEDERIALGRLLQGQASLRPAELWSHDDPTHPAARSAVLTSLRGLDFAGAELTARFEASGAEVRLNDGSSFTDLARGDLARRRHDARYVAALLLLDRLLRPRARYEDSLGPYRAHGFQRSRHEIDEGVYRYTGTLTLEDTETDRRHGFEYLLLEDHREGVSLYLQPADATGKPDAFDLQTLPMGDRLEIVQLMGADLEGNLASETQAIFPLLRKSLVYARLLDVPPLPMVRSLMELAVTRKLLGMTEGHEAPGADTMNELEEELAFARDFSLQLDAERLNHRFSRWLARALDDPSTFTSEPVVRSVEALLASLGRWGFHPDLTVAQALVFEELRDRVPPLLESLEKGQIESLHELKRLMRLGTLLWLDTSWVKNRVLDL